MRPTFSSSIVREERLREINKWLKKGLEILMFAGKAAHLYRDVNNWLTSQNSLPMKTMRKFSKKRTTRRIGTLAQGYAMRLFIRRCENWAKALSVMLTHTHS